MSRNIIVSDKEVEFKLPPKEYYEEINIPISDNTIAIYKELLSVYLLEEMGRMLKDQDK